MCCRVNNFDFLLQHGSSFSSDTVVAANQIADGSVTNSNFVKLARLSVNVEDTFSNVFSDIGDINDSLAVTGGRLDILEAPRDELLTSLTVTREDGVTTLRSGTGITPGTTCLGAFSIKDAADTAYHVTVGSLESNFYSQSLNIHGGKLTIKNGGTSKYEIFQDESNQCYVNSHAFTLNNVLPTIYKYTDVNSELPSNTTLLPVGTIFSLTRNITVADNVTQTNNLLPGTGVLPFGVWSVQVRASLIKNNGVWLSPTYWLITVTAATFGDDYFAVSQSGEQQTGTTPNLAQTITSHMYSTSGQMVPKMTSNIDISSLGSPTAPIITISSSFLKVA